MVINIEICYSRNVIRSVGASEEKQLPSRQTQSIPEAADFRLLVLENAVGPDIESWIMLFATAIGARSRGKEQDETQMRCLRPNSSFS
jgi:hypothetical protein